MLAIEVVLAKKYTDGLYEVLHANDKEEDAVLEFIFKSLATEGLYVIYSLPIPEENSPVE